ncbi:MAG TPA: hypothetical protein DF364_04580, partial [Ruminococcaceae bacterium]|nr:hypothetical protein [Oscillospiraceae bacterium]
FKSRHSDHVAASDTKLAATFLCVASKSFLIYCEEMRCIYEQDKNAMYTFVSVLELVGSPAV